MSWERLRANRRGRILVRTGGEWHRRPHDCRGSGADEPQRISGLAQIPRKVWTVQPDDANGMGRLTGCLGSGER